MSLIDRHVERLRSLKEDILFHANAAKEYRKELADFKAELQKYPDLWQDVNRTFTTEERQLSVRMDCRIVQREAA